MNNLDDVVIVSAVRTPFGRFGGVMKDISSLELGVRAIRKALEKLGQGTDLVDELYFGTCVLPENALETNVLGRQAVLKAGLPPETLSLTIDKACCSSMTALHLGYRSIKSGEADVVVAVGSENMSRAPFLAPEVRWGQRLGPAQLIDPLYALGYAEWNPVSVDAGEVALQYGVTREEQDRWALRSQRYYAQACSEGKFTEEVFSLEVSSEKKTVTVEQDEQPRPDVTLEQLSKLPTVYGSPTITPGNAPGMNTGAGAIVLMSRRKAEALGVEVLGAVRSIASVALEPHLIAAVPAPALEKVLERSGEVSLEQLSLIEINEAFAAMPLVSSKILAAGGWSEETSPSKGDLSVDLAKLEQLREKINVNGGAVAIGHPVGASGARITMSLLYELRRRGGGYGAAAICGGLAQGDAVLLEV